MQEVTNFLSNYFNVTTIIGLIAAIIAGVIFVIYTQNKLSKIKDVTKVINSNIKAGVAKSLAEVVDLDELSKTLPDDEKAKIIKQILSDKQKRFDSQIGVAKFGIILISVLVILLMLSSLFSTNKKPITPDTVGLNAAFMISDSTAEKSLSTEEIENLIDGKIKIEEIEHENKLRIKFTFPDSSLNKYGFKFSFSNDFYNLLGGNKISVPGWKSRAINNNSNRVYFVKNGDGFDKNLSFTTTYIGDEK